MPKWKPFLKYKFPRNTCNFVFITEIIWRNNWWSIIDELEGLGLQGKNFLQGFLGVDKPYSGVSSSKKPDFRPDFKNFL